MADIARSLARLRVPLGFVLGIVVVVLATPTIGSLIMGSAIALAGEALRFWAAGHLEKGSEVTRSGPYRITRHPLYLGSAIIGAGVSVAAHNVTVAALVTAYLGATLLAAIRHEEAGMRARFGDQYDAYAQSRAQPVSRPFSFERAIRNKEHQTLAGLLLIAMVFALKIVGADR